MIEDKNPIDRGCDDIDLEEMEKEELLNNYQVVRGEFFAHTFDAAVTFRYDSLSFNSAAIGKIDDAMYVQVLICPSKRKMIIKKCDIDDKNSARWCKIDKKTGKRASRRMSAKMFSAKLYDLMKWNPENRYRIQCAVMKCEEETILVFNLDDVETFVPRKKGDDEATQSKRSYFPEDWRDSFGVTYGELKKSIGIDMLEGFALMEVIVKKEVKPKAPSGFELKKVGDGGGGNGNS